MNFPEIYSCAQMTELIEKIGFLPLLDSGIRGFSAEEIVADDCRYVVFPDGGWDWPMWKWKGQIVTETNCAYGKFFNKKAGYISRVWWPDFCNFRRSIYPRPEEGSIEEMILSTLAENGSLITRQLRAACGFTGPNMRSKFDGFLTRLQMSTYIITEDFVYPHDKHGKEYGWGWSLLTCENTPNISELVEGRSPKESYDKIFEHLHKLLPNATNKQIAKLIG